MNGRVLALLGFLFFISSCAGGEGNNWPGEKWEKTFGGADTDDLGRSVQQTWDGGYIIAGETYSASTGNKYDVYLIKTDPSGNLYWQRTFGGTGNDLALSVQQTSDGGYIMAGWTNSIGAGSYDVYLIKTDSAGNKTWEKTFGGTGDDSAYSVQQTSDQGYIIVGITDSIGAGSDDVYLIKTDSLGNKTWEKTFGGIYREEGRFVQQTSDGGYIIAGSTYSMTTRMDIYLIKTDSSGNETWHKTFGQDWEDFGYSVRETGDGDYVLAGVDDYDGCLIKTDSNGNIIWEKFFGALEPFSMGLTSDGGYVLAGLEYYSADCQKADSYGNLEWDMSYADDFASSVQQTSDGGYILTGAKCPIIGPCDVYLRKTDPLGYIW